MARSLRSAISRYGCVIAGENKVMEKIMNRIKNWIAISAFSLLILGVPAIASAQWGGSNGGYYGNGNIKSTVRNLKNRAKSFERDVDRYDDRYDNRNNRGGYGGYGNNNYNGDLNDLADQFKDATNDLEDAYGNGRNLNNSADEARRVLDIASEIDRAVYNSRGGRSLQGQWSSMRQDLNVLANTYGYNYNRNNRNNRNNRSGDWRSRVPFPLPF